MIFEALGVQMMPDALLAKTMSLCCSFHVCELLGSYFLSICKLFYVDPSIIFSVITDYFLCPLYDIFSVCGLFSDVGKRVLHSVHGHHEGEGPHEQVRDRVPGA